MNKTLSSTTAFNFQWRDYLELCKPRVVALMLLTVIVGMQLASPHFIALRILIWGTIGIALTSGAAAVINHLVDQRIDALMARTRQRPLPTGRVTSAQAFLFAITLSILGVGILIAFINVLTAILTLLTFFGYAIIYSMYLKRATPQNIVIGGLAGAMPPLLGWTAVTNHLDPQALLLVLVIFTWTPPHFWALAIARYQEYAKAEIPMLPVTHGIRFTKINILLYTMLLVAASLLLYVFEVSGMIYLIGAIILDAGFVFYAVKLYQSDTNTKVAMQTFRYSIIYLMALFVVLLVDHFVGVFFYVS